MDAWPHSKGCLKLKDSWVYFNVANIASNGKVLSYDIVPTYNIMYTN